MNQLSIIFAKISPIIGGFIVFSSIEALQASTPWDETWHVAMSVGLGIFVTLVGMIYRNLDRRIGELERDAKDKFIPRNEYDARHNDLVKQLDRIESKIK